MDPVSNINRCPYGNGYTDRDERAYSYVDTIPDSDGNQHAHGNINRSAYH